MQFSDRIGRRMKLQDLHVLMTVVQAGSMGKAAQLLNTTQPNISRSIAELEHASACACSIGIARGGADRVRSRVAEAEWRFSTSCDRA